MNLLNVFGDTLKTTTLAADGNRYAAEFVCVSLSVTTKRGKLLCHYSVSQKNVTGIIKQCERALTLYNYNESKHNVTITIS